MKLLSDKERVNECGRRQPALTVRRNSAPTHVGGHGLVAGPRHSVSRSESGSSLIVTLVIGMVIIIVLMSYLQLLEGRTITRTRSLSWNSAIPILEAGIEEACTQINEYSSTSSTLACNGWTNSVVNTHNLYSKRRDFSDGSYCIVTISNVDTLPPAYPVVYSQGFVPAPYKDGYISRTVQVMLTNTLAFSKAIAAKAGVNLAGQATVDGFDSSNTNYSTGGAYDSSKRTANGSIVTNGKGNGIVDVKNGHIYGNVTTGPGGTVSYVSGGTVGDVAWSASNSGVEPGYATDGMNASYPDNSAPAGYSSWSAPVSGNYANGYKYSLGSGGYYVNGGFSLKNNMIITGNATFYISGDLSINAGGTIYIAPGASLKIYVGGSATINGGGFVNGTGTANNLSYIGLPTNTSINFSGNADYIGTFNAPEADFTQTGSASLVGAAIVNSFTGKSSGVAFHYDAGITNLGPLKVCDYKEL